MCSRSAACGSSATRPLGSSRTCSDPQAEEAATAQPDPEEKKTLTAAESGKAGGTTVWIKRAVILGLTGLGLYVVWPSLAAVFSAGPQLKTVNPLWGLPIVLAEVASFACMWALLRLALDVKPWYPIATAQLAGNAFSRFVPGGAAAGGALQFDMLRQAGITATWAATGVTAVSLISTATLLGLPAISIVSILITGASVEHNLFRVGSIAVVVCLGALAGGAVLLFANGPLLWTGRVIQNAHNRVLRQRRPMTDLPERLVDERDLIRQVLGAGWWEALLYSAGNWLLDLVALLIALAAVGAEPRASVVLLAYVVAAFLGMVHITPGGLGFVEAGLVGTLGLAGVTAEQAVLATLVYRLVSFWLPMPVGAVAYFLAARRYGRPQHLEKDAEGRIVR